MLRMRYHGDALLTLALVLTAVCSSCSDDDDDERSDGDAATDAAPVDTTPADTAPVDTTPADTAPVDTTPADTTPTDTEPADATPADTAPADTAPSDTTPADATYADATPADTTSADTTPADTALADTTPTNTAPAPLGWSYEGMAVGSLASPSPLGSLLMPEVHRFGAVYRLYFNQSSGPGLDRIVYADSPDAVTWTWRETVFTGSDKDHYITGGARVVDLDDGRYRMYIQSSVAVASGPPRYKAYRLISNDGITFALEPGVRIDIQPDDPTSPFKLAGHGAYYRAAEGTWRAVISADPVGVQGPSDLYFGSSADGLTWGDWQPLYADFHDPVVIAWRGKYYLFAKLMQEHTYMAVSDDGMSWPPMTELARQTFFGEDGRDVSEAIGDNGAMIVPSGELWLLSNWGVLGGPGSVSTAVALWSPVAP